MCMSDDRWIESTEGDLDPDLTEEAGYMGWEPPRRRGWSLLLRAAIVVVLLSMAVGALFILFR